MTNHIYTFYCEKAESLHLGKNRRILHHLAILAENPRDASSIEYLNAQFTIRVERLDRLPLICFGDDEPCKGDIVIGKDLSTQKDFSLTLNDTLCHMLFTGQTRTGKTSNIRLLAYLIMLLHSNKVKFLIFDIKNDFLSFLLTFSNYINFFVSSGDFRYSPLSFLPPSYYSQVFAYSYGILEAGQNLLHRVLIEMVKNGIPMAEKNMLTYLLDLPPIFRDERSSSVIGTLKSRIWENVNFYAKMYNPFETFNISELLSKYHVNIVIDDFHPSHYCFLALSIIQDVYLAKRQAKIDGHVIIVLSEIQASALGVLSRNSAHSGYLVPYLSTLMLLSRGAGISFWIDGQEPSLLLPSIKSECTRIFNSGLAGRENQEILSYLGDL